MFPVRVDQRDAFLDQREAYSSVASLWLLSRGHFLQGQQLVSQRKIWKGYDFSWRSLGCVSTAIAPISEYHWDQFDVPASPVIWNNVWAPSYSNHVIDNCRLGNRMNVPQCSLSFPFLCRANFIDFLHNSHEAWFCTNALDLRSHCKWFSFIKNGCEELTYLAVTSVA